MDIEKLKMVAGEKACEHVRDGMVLGLGTGSTVYYAIKMIGELVKDGHELVGIATSIQTDTLARELGIPLTNLKEHPDIDLTIDGADEIDPDLNLIKGLGGALIREKIVASASKKMVVVADETKAVEVLGTKAPLPVEVTKFGITYIERELQALGCRPEIRLRDGQPLISDNHNLILDCHFEKISEPRLLETKINNIPGVVNNGLFIGLATNAIIAHASGEIEER